jgi:hypothetical protein
LKVMRLTVGRGRTSRPSDAEEWTKEYFEIEMIVEDPAELEVAKANLTGLIDGWLSSSKHSQPAAKPAPRQEITMTPEEIDKLPWIASNWIRRDDKDRNARPGEDAWIKLENSDSRLIRMIDEAPDGKLSLPPYEFEFKTFADSSTKLIVRRGPKEEKKA